MGSQCCSLEKLIIYGMNISRVDFVCQPRGVLALLVVPARGLAKADFMGDLTWMLAHPV